jgi:hypothetical protein
MSITPIPRLARPSEVQGLLVGQIRQARGCTNGAELVTPTLRKPVTNNRLSRLGCGFLATALAGRVNPYTLVDDGGVFPRTLGPRLGFTVQRWTGIPAAWLEGFQSTWQAGSTEF